MGCLYPKRNRPHTHMYQTMTIEQITNQLTWVRNQIVASFASLKKQAETLFRLICCERKTLFWLKNKLKKTDYKRSEHGL